MNLGSKLASCIFELFATTLWCKFSIRFLLFLQFYSATAAWWTGGSVDKIEVYQNEGGVTHFRGGIRMCIIPAGYVGVSFWAGVLVALSGSRVGATIAASVFGLAMLVCLR
jgi:hypothetical protein